MTLHTALQVQQVFFVSLGLETFRGSDSQRRNVADGIGCGEVLE